MQNNRESQSCYDSIYDRVIKYQVRAECREPLHIGSGEKEQGEILIHPVEDRPFIPATGIAGLSANILRTRSCVTKCLET